MNRGRPSVELNPPPRLSPARTIAGTLRRPVDEHAGNGRRGETGNGADRRVGAESGDNADRGGEASREGDSGSERGVDRETEIDPAVATTAREELRTTFAYQVERLREIDTQAIKILKANLVLIGIVVTGGSIVVQTEFDLGG